MPPRPRIRSRRGPASLAGQRGAREQRRAVDVEVEVRMSSDSQSSSKVLPGPRARLPRRAPSRARRRRAAVVGSDVVLHAAGRDRRDASAPGIAGRSWRSRSRTPCAAPERAQRGARVRTSRSPWPAAPGAPVWASVIVERVVSSAICSSAPRAREVQRRPCHDVRGRHLEPALSSRRASRGAAARAPARRRRRGRGARPQPERCVGAAARAVAASPAGVRRRVGRARWRCPAPCGRSSP